MAINVFLSQRVAGIPLVGWFAVACCLLILIGLVFYVGGIREMRENKSYHFAEAYASDGSVVKSRSNTISSPYYDGRQAAWHGFLIALSAGVGLTGFLILL